MTMVVFVSPRLSVVLRKSAAVSPTVVARTLMTQKAQVGSGTLLKVTRLCGRVRLIGGFLSVGRIRGATLCRTAETTDRLARTV